MELTVTQTPDHACFQVNGKIDEVGADEMKRRFNELALGSIREVVFDFGRVTHIGSAGLGKLLLFYKAVRTHGGNLRIENASEQVYDLLLDLELNKVFAVSKS